MIVVNFKAYPLKYFDKVFNAIKEINNKYGKIVYFAIPSPFLYLSKEYDFILAQDFTYKEGPYTGEVNYEMLEKLNVKGSLLNHSEKQRPFNEICKIIKKVDKDFNLIVCADSEESVLMLKNLKPKFVAYEPPELIGGNISVSKAKPEIIEKLTKELDNLLVGAGIKNKEDVKKSLDLGAIGVLVASGVIKNKDPYKLLEEWITLF